MSISNIAYAKNMGTLDRAIRTILGLGLLSLVFIGPKTLWGITGVVPIATAIIGYCPPYKWLGINTRRRRKNTARK